MNFANPLFFWGFLSLIPLIAIYLLKVKPVRKPTTAFFLWENIFQEKKATSLFQRFRDLFSLLMMALAFAAIVLALVRPDFSGVEQNDLILLIDNSASMNAETGSTTRLDEAKKVASQIVRALNGTQRCSVATISNEATYISHLTDNPRELLDAIAKIEPSALPSEIGALQPFSSIRDVNLRTPAARNPSSDPEATDVADAGTDEGTATTADQAKHRVIMITDGCLGGNVPADIELLKIGDSNGNLGLIACDVQRIPGGSNRIGVFFQLASTFQDSVEAELVLSQQSEDNLVKLVPLVVEPGINPAGVFELDNAPEGKWFVRVEATSQTDSLVDDNVAFLTLPPKRPIPVSVVAKERFFFENSVLAFSQDAGLLRLVDQDATTTQLMIGTGNFEFDRQSAPDLLIFQPSGESDWWSDLGEEIEVLLPTAVDENHPVIRHLDVASIPFVGARRLTAPSGAEILAVAEDETPLIYRTTNAGRTAIVVNLDPLESQFYFSAWFPVLVYSSATHLAGRAESIRSSYPSGQFANIPGAGPGESTTVVEPDEASRVITDSAFGPLRRLGHYELSNTRGDWLAGCSLLSPVESLIDNGDVFDTSKPVKRGPSLTAILTLIAIMVVAAESVLYQRRKVG